MASDAPRSFGGSQAVPNHVARLLKSDDRFIVIRAKEFLEQEQ